MSYLRDQAEDLAIKAKYRDGEDEQTKAVGEGLAAIAYALLDVAQAIRDSRE
ncbi:MULTISPECIES: hypothetical protein [unclassified Streptomyces]|uniref:hypothetical protein n=1 Tax=unclassified Streptomyces TaxID=2593676 RepID=UPI002E150FCE|nr:hypothetical protein OG573_40275 [Streptomyces sp. NBC_01205]